MNVCVGQVWRVKTGEVFRINELTEIKFDGVILDKDMKPTNFHIAGARSKLIPFLTAQDGKQLRVLRLIGEESCR